MKSQKPTSGYVTVPALRAIIVASITLGLLLLVLFSAQLFERITQLREVPRDNAQWNLSQLEVDFLKLDRAARAIADQGEPALAAFRLRYDVFYSRVHLVSDSKDAKYVHENLELHMLHKKLLRFLMETVELVDGPDAELVANIDIVQKLLAEISEAPRALSLGAIKITSRESDLQRIEITRLLQRNIFVAAIVMVALLAASIVLMRQRQVIADRAAKLRDASVMQDSTLRASLDAIVVIDETGRITDFNGSAEKIFGFSKHEVIGQPLRTKLVPERFRKDHDIGLAQYNGVSGSSIVDKGRLELVALHAAGHEFPIEISITETKGENGNFFISYIRDITEDQQNKLELKQARDDALAAYRDKSRFFAIMSHEMRTPLNGIMSALELMKDDELSASQARHVQIAQTSSNILLGHVNDVLTIETLDSGEVEMQSEVIEIDAMIAELSASMQPLAKKQNTRLKVQTVGDLRPVMGDPRAIQQVLSNLLSNAIKFTSSGTVTIKTAAETLPDNRVDLQFEVKDTGVGISEEQRIRIFDDFVTAESPYERTATGTGLGLGIARRLVAAMGGALECESKINKGSTFRFSITLDCAKQSDISQNAEQIAAIAKAKKSKAKAMDILVVEDNAINAELLEAMLVKDGHRVSHAVDGFEGVHMAANTHFDLILMDISMPGMNGIKATQEIRSSRGLSRTTPIYAITANAMPKEVLQFEMVGMAGHLLKPIQTAQLRKLLCKVAKNITLTRKSDPPSELPHNSDHLDLGQLKELTEILGEENVRKKLENFMLEGDDLLAELSTFCAREDTAGLKAGAHKFAGSCATFGAVNMAGKLRAIENACKEGKFEDAREITRNLDPIWRATQAAYKAQDTTIY